MKKTLLLSLMVLMCAVACAFGLAACGNGDGNSGECEHSFVQKALHEATCTEGSYYDEECSKCGEKRKGKEIQAARGHGRTSAPVYNNDETCTKNGTWTYKCTRCQDMITEEVQGAMWHKYTDSPNCIHCGKAAGNKYLTYTLNQAGDGYVVEYKPDNNDGIFNSYGKDTAMRVISIPAEFDGKPVVEIKKLFDNSYCSTEVVYIPASVEKIDSLALSNRNLYKVVIAEGSKLKTIEYNAFAYSQITELILPEGMTELKTGALNNMLSLTCITIPSTLTTIDEGCFGYNIRLNTIINKSDLPMTEEVVKKYFSLRSNSELPAHFAVRENNPNWLLTEKCIGTHNYNQKDFEADIRFSYIHLDGENILTNLVYDDYTAGNSAAFNVIDVPFGITQVDSSALDYGIAKILKLPNSVKSINKVAIPQTGYNTGTNSIFGTGRWQELSISEYTDTSDFTADDFIKNEKNILKSYKDENPAYCTLDFNFYDAWDSVKTNGYTYEKDGVTVKFTRLSGDMTGVGEINSASAGEPANVGFNDLSDLVITISIDDEDARYAKAISLSGRNPFSAQHNSVNVNGFYYDKEQNDFVSGHSEKTFSSTVYSEIEFDSAKKLGKGDWKFELTNSGKYGYRLLSLKITLETFFNADLTVKK